VAIGVGTVVGLGGACIYFSIHFGYRPALERNNAVVTSRHLAGTDR
jgi:hypothetical protein